MDDVVQVVGADRLAATLREFSRSLDDLSDANRRAGEAVASAAVSRVPRRTGRLAGSQRVDAAPADVSVAFGAVYASPIHWGVGPRVGLRGPHNLPATLFLTDALAAQGRYDAATHLLLKRSVGQIAAARPGLVEPATTARELAALGALPDAARAAFGIIAVRVERSRSAVGCTEAQRPAVPPRGQRAWL